MPDTKPVTEAEIRQLLETIRGQAADARTLATQQAAMLVGVVSTLAEQWDSMASDIERRLDKSGFAAPEQIDQTRR